MIYNSSRHSTSPRNSAQRPAPRRRTLPHIATPLCAPLRTASRHHATRLSATQRNRMHRIQQGKKGSHRVSPLCPTSPRCTSPRNTAHHNRMSSVSQGIHNASRRSATRHCASHRPAPLHDATSRHRATHLNSPLHHSPQPPSYKGTAQMTIADDIYQFLRRYEEENVMPDGDGEAEAYLRNVHALITDRFPGATREDRSEAFRLMSAYHGEEAEKAAFMFKLMTGMDIDDLMSPRKPQ